MIERDGEINKETEKGQEAEGPGAFDKKTK